MKLGDIKPTRRFPFTRKCKRCSYQLTIYTQEDNNPEYYADVFIPCPSSECDEFIDFFLPVNQSHILIPTRSAL